MKPAEADKRPQDFTFFGFELGRKKLGIDHRGFGASGNYSKRNKLLLLPDQIYKKNEFPKLF
mgnify:CR=1 FL=1